VHFTHRFAACSFAVTRVISASGCRTEYAAVPHRRNPSRQRLLSEFHVSVTEPGADGVPARESPRGVVDATGCRHSSAIYSLSFFKVELLIGRYRSRFCIAHLKPSKANLKLGDLKPETLSRTIRQFRPIASGVAAEPRIRSEYSLRPCSNQ